MAITGYLTTVLDVQSAAFNRKLNHAASSVQRFSAITISHLRRMATVAALVHLARSAFRFAVELGELADQLEIDVNKLMQLQGAATLFHVSVEKLNRGLERLQRTLGDPKALKLFAELGLDAAKLRKMDLDQSFLAVAEAISRIEDPTLRAAKAFEILGKQSAEMLRMIKVGETGIRGMGQEATNLGMVLTQQQIRNIEDADIIMKKLSMGLKIHTAKAISEIAEFPKNLGIILKGVYTGPILFRGPGGEIIRPPTAPIRAPSFIPKKFVTPD